MLISNQLNKYTNSLIKEFSLSDLEMSVSIDNQLIRFIPNEYDFKTVRELFKEISLFPIKNEKRISFSEISPGKLLECIERFKEWASSNGFKWFDNEAEWNRIYELYK